MDEMDQDAPSSKALVIKSFRGGYARSIGLQLGDRIVGLDGEEFFGSTADLNERFDVDEEEHESSSIQAVLTVCRESRIFNVIIDQPLSVTFEEKEVVEDILPTKLEELLQNAKSKRLYEYMIFHDIKKNAELVLKSKSLLAMIIPPFWFLNQRVWEAAIASILGFIATFAVHWLLAAIYFAVLCLYVGREHMNLAVSFMSYRRFIYLQTIAAETELQAQRVALDLDGELFFRQPVHGLEQTRPKKRKKKLTRV
ncbi:MAG: hypothetical protein ACPHL3_05615 [Paracoccaceae bacterium]